MRAPSAVRIVLTMTHIPAEIDFCVKQIMKDNLTAMENRLACGGT
jgi:hypothetical protein